MSTALDPLVGPARRRFFAVEEPSARVALALGKDQTEQAHPGVALLPLGSSSA
jgi:hypothetical protein